MLRFPAIENKGFLDHYKAKISKYNFNSLMNILLRKKNDEKKKAGIYTINN